LHDVATGANVCGRGAAANHGLSETALKFLGGMLTNTPAMTALTNPTVNSYKRLNASSTTSGATWSPAAATWGGNNRSNLVRVPGEFSESSGGARFELRLADGAANPYLLPAAIATAGMEGLAGRAPVAPPPCDMNMYDATNPEVVKAASNAPQLPRSLEAALNELGKSTVFTSGGMGETVAAFIKLRRKQWEEYTAQLTTWELQAYLDC